MANVSNSSDTTLAPLAAWPFRQTDETKRLASIKALEDKQAKELAEAERQVSEARKKLVALAPHKG